MQFWDFANEVAWTLIENKSKVRAVSLPAMAELLVLKYS